MKDQNKADENRAKTIANLNKATKLQNQAAKDLDKAITGVNETYKGIIENCKPEHSQQAQETIIKVNKLLRKLKEGGNKESIIKQLNKLRIK